MADFFRFFCENFASCYTGPRRRWLYCSLPVALQHAGYWSGFAMLVFAKQTDNPHVIRTSAGLGAFER